MSDPWESAKLIGSITYSPEGTKIDQSSISQIKFSPDGTLIASQVFEERIRVWDLETGERKFTLKKTLEHDYTDPITTKSYKLAGVYESSTIGDVNFSSDSKSIVFFIRGPLIGSNNRLCRVNVDAPATQEGNASLQCFLLSTNQEMGRSLLLSSDGKTVISGGWIKKITGWNINGKDVKQLFRTKEYGEMSSMANNNTSTGVVNELSQSADNTMFMAVMTDNPAVVFDVKTGSEIVSFGTKSDKFTTGLLRNEIAVLGNESGQISVWSTSNGKMLKTISAHRDKINSVLVSPDAKYIFSGSSDKTIKVWNLTSGELITTFLDCNSEVNSLDITKDGKILGAGCGDGSMKLWRVTK